MNLPSLKKANVKNKAILVRTDFDVPMTKGLDGLEVKDDFRLQRSIETIRYLIDQDCKVVLLSKLGRPKGQDPKLSLKPVAQKVAELLRYGFFPVAPRARKLPEHDIPRMYFLEGSPIASRVEAFLPSIVKKDIVCLDNLLFEGGEKEGDLDFAKKLSQYGEIYVNDSFATAHREYASVVALPGLLPHYAGLNFEQEIKTLSLVLDRPKRPYIAMIGGVKLGEKLDGLEGMIEHADRVLLGGGLATLFFAVLDYQTGKSILEGGSVSDAREIWRNYKDKIVLPKDVVVARSLKQAGTARVSAPNSISPGEMILDIGPETIRSYSEFIKQGRTLVWSGPMGMFEVDAFAHGTKALGRLFASRCRGIAFGVAGGGNTLDALDRIKMGQYIHFLSCGGSAMVQFLGRETMPAIEALTQ